MRISRRWLVLASLVLALGTARAHADDAPRPAWADDVQALRAETEPAKRMEKTWALLAKKPDVAALRAELSRPFSWKADAPKERVQWERDAGGSGKLTIFAYVPKAYTPEKAWPVLVWMHGAINRDEDGLGEGGVGWFRDDAEAKGYLVLSPSGTRNTMWWSAAGVEHLHAALAELARRYHVDPDRVVAAGFSDGASGCYHLLAHAPDAYACFLALMGNPLITRLLGGPAFAGNCTARSTWAVNGGKDELFPADQVEPIVASMKDVGIPIEWKAIPEATHSMDLLSREAEAMFAFAHAHPRNPLPKQVDWECVLPQIDGRRAWVEVLTVSEAAPGAPDVPSKPLAMPEVPKRPRLGITIDTKYEGAGLRIEKVESGSPAAEAGFKAGDVIAKVGADDLPSGAEAFAALREYLAGLDAVDGEFTVQRNSETVTIKTRPRILASDAPDPALGYGKPSGRVIAEVLEGNRIEVKTRGISALRLHLARPLVDPTKEVVVVLNGKEAFKGVPKPDAAYLLDQALRSLPGEPLYEANLTLKP